MAVCEMVCHLSKTHAGKLRETQARSQEHTGPDTVLYGFMCKGADEKRITVYVRQRGERNACWKELHRRSDVMSAIVQSCCGFCRE